jgi:hypothetical protein
MEMEAPWHRENRSGVRQSYVAPEPHSRKIKAESDDELLKVAPVEFSSSFTDTLPGAGRQSLHCPGGTGTALLNFNQTLGIVTEVGWCKMPGPGLNLSGDATTFDVGPRFSYRSGRTVDSAGSCSFRRHHADSGIVAA